jgi:hypothetical protein
MVREYPIGSGREEARWPMFWAGKEGSCPFIKPQPEKKPISRPTLQENTNVVNHVSNRKEQPASGIINSSNAFSAIRSTTTCGSKSMTSALSGMGGAIHLKDSLSRQIRDMKTRLTPMDPRIEIKTPMNPPPAKRRKLETLREQIIKKKPKREGYCENCKEKYDDYDEV